MKPSDEVFLLTFLGCLIVGLVGGFFYFTLVYNNNQNIKRDEYYASHCKTVKTDTTVDGNTIYKCGD